MRQWIFLLLMSCVWGEKMYVPQSKEELRGLIVKERISPKQIDVSKIKDMSYVFCIDKNDLRCINPYNLPDEAIDFSGIEAWDVSQVENMEGMFKGARLNAPLASWNVAKVKNMKAMFAWSSFNAPINLWNVSSVEDMSYMFAGSSFNQPLNSWNVGNVRDMSGMFFRSRFNQPLNSWNVSNVENMKLMFAQNFSFNQPLDQWNVAKVKNMGYMFHQARSFTQSLEKWDMRNVIISAGMLEDTHPHSQIPSQHNDK